MLTKSGKGGRDPVGVGEFLEDNEIQQTELSAGIGMTLPTLNRKIRGRRPWRVEEANRVVVWLREQGIIVTLDELFGDAIVTDTAEESELVPVEASRQ